MLLLIGAGEGPTLSFAILVHSSFIHAHDNAFATIFAILGEEFLGNAGSLGHTRSRDIGIWLRCFRGNLGADLAGGGCFLGRFGQGGLESVDELDLVEGIKALQGLLVETLWERGFRFYQHRVKDDLLQPG
jgi:hypothetical protein